ncbi:hypothetical protein BC834DRAFT_829629 [Gloeopeniophorella convolvens]|nr:hypothetical protein BC834DRAFT_829629 [Gloeopeniophorella convolvens]
MAAYFRSLFGIGQSSAPGHSSSKPKPHRRTQSSPAPNYIYAPPPGTTPSTSTSRTTRSKVQRANSYTTPPTMVPSPLRYPTYDSRHSHETSRPPIYRGTSYKVPDQHGRFPQFPQGGYVTPGSSRSNSSSSLYPGPVHSTHSVPSPLVTSFPGSKAPESRPVLKQTNTWPTGGVPTSASGASSTYGPTPSPTRSQARAPRLHMHPLLSYARLHHAPISYDIAFTPSARTVLDRTIHAPVPAVTLAQPATEPPTPASSRLVLRSPKLPWVVVIGPIGSTPSFFIGKGRSARKTTTTTALTNLDVLYAVHTTLMTRVTPEEWASLGNGSRAQRRVADAYEKRCTRMGGGWEGGVRRLDWLGSKNRLVGVEIDKSSTTGENVGKLVFGRE